jgi:putative transposase
LFLRGTAAPPRTIQVDNGSEFTANHFDAWAYLRGIDVNFIRPGKPVDNAHIESFNGRLRGEWKTQVPDAE